VSGAATPLPIGRQAEGARRGPEPTVWLRGVALALFALVPLVIPSFQATDLAIKIAIFGALVASYDVVIGYTGIVSFGHAMYFGFGAYAVALAVGRFGAPTYGHLLVGFLSGMVASALVAVLIGAFSLRVKAIFFAMITLAFAEFSGILAVQWSALTGGEDGLSPRLPGIFAVAYDGGRVFGIPLTGKLVTYYVVLGVCAGLFLVMSRFVASPLGRTLQAIRDNELRAEALGVPTFALQIASSTFASVVAAIVGGCYLMWVRYVNPESALGVPVMLDVLLMVIIGGVGTLWGSLIGAAVLLTARLLLPDLRGLAVLLGGSELAQRLNARWLLIFGVLFIPVVFFFSKGVLGTAREALRRRRLGAAPES